MLNRCDFIGHLGKDPETRALPSGDIVCNFSVAASEKWTDKQGRTQERTEWVNCVTFGKLSDICAKYLAKGSKVYVSGKMRTRKWQDSSGQDKYTTEVVLSEMRMLDSKGEGGGSQSAQRGSQEPQRAPQEPERLAADFGDFDDGDIPF